MDVTVVGAGIIGCSAAALLAEAGARVTVHERSAVAAGASGRNSGVLQHPLDRRLSDLHAESVRLHREVADLADEPDGILLLGARSAEGLPPEVEPEVVEDARTVEPVLRTEVPAVRLRTGWVVGPATLTEAWWRRAERAGARLVLGEQRLPPADVTLRATGAWTSGVTPLWGVTARTRTRARHVLEEAAANAVVDGQGGEVFTLVGDVLGSSASLHEPDPVAVAERLRARAEPLIGPVEITATRACPRPSTPDALPLVGRTGEATFVCAGHGAWGISVGPATSRMVVDAILGRGEPPRHLDPHRFTGDAAGQPEPR